MLYQFFPVRPNPVHPIIEPEPAPACPFENISLLVCRTSSNIASTLGHKGWIFFITEYHSVQSSFQYTTFCENFKRYICAFLSISNHFSFSSTLNCRTSLLLYMDPIDFYIEELCCLVKVDQFIFPDFHSFTTVLLCRGVTPFWWPTRWFWSATAISTSKSKINCLQYYAKCGNTFTNTRHIYVYGWS